MGDIDLETLNPGIRWFVGWLRNLGFDTCDSGDGVTHEHLCDRETPYVAIRVHDPMCLIPESNRLFSNLEGAGISLEDIHIQANYSPQDGFAFIDLSGGGLLIPKPPLEIPLGTS